ncbi:hypothetical protein D0B32_11920 [Paraburkholderia sp. DHOC27]|nr:hypothetical protein D0B32_11920 [Paraburkholderia sp. DHOC27]
MFMAAFLDSSVCRSMLHLPTMGSSALRCVPAGIIQPT